MVRAPSRFGLIKSRMMSPPMTTASLGFILRVWNIFQYILRFDFSQPLSTSNGEAFASSTVSVKWLRVLTRSNTTALNFLSLHRLMNGRISFLEVLSVSLIVIEVSIPWG